MGVGPSRLPAIGRMAAVGASRALPCVPAKVSNLTESGRLGRAAGTAQFAPKATFALRGSSGCIEQEKTVCSGLRSVPGGGRVLAWVRELADAGSGPALIRRGPIFRAYPVDAQTHNCLRTGKKLRGHRALALAFSRSVAYGLDIMAIRVEHKSTVIVTMIIWSRPWSAVVAPTSGKCSRMKGIYRRTV